MNPDVTTSNGWIKRVGDYCVTVTVSSEILSRSNNNGLTRTKTTQVYYSIFELRISKKLI